MKRISRAVLISGFIVAGTASAQEAAPGGQTLTPTTGSGAAPAAAPAPQEKASGGAGLGLSPTTPQIGGGQHTLISSQKAEEVLTPTTGGGSADEWKFDFHGYMRAPMRLSWGVPTPTRPPTQDMPATEADIPPGTQLHSFPRVPGASYIDWTYTNTIPGPWAQLNFSYGNSRAMMTVIVASYSQTDAGYRNLQAQLGINHAFLTLNFPEAFGDRGGLVWNIGSFANRYGTAGKYDAGMYETYLFGKTHVVGETLTANLDLGGPWSLSLEKGVGSKIEVIPFTNSQLYQIFKTTPTGTGWGNPPNLWSREPEGLPYPGPVPQGSTFLAHGHAGLAYKKLLTFGAHFIYSWTNDDNWDPVNSALQNVSDLNPRAMGPTRGRMMVFGGDVRLNGGVLGDGYLGYSRVDASNILAMSDSLEVLHSFGGWQFKQNYFGRNFYPRNGIYNGPQNESGTVDTVSLQYTFSFGALARYPENFWGQGPDVAVTVFGMFNKVNSTLPAGAALPVACSAQQCNMSTKKLKFGADVIYTPLSWFGVGGRFDMVQPDLDATYAFASNQGGSDLNFMVFSPRVVIRTNFLTHEAVTIMYQRYVNNAGVFPVFPYEWAPKADSNVFAIAGTMWW